MFCPSACFSGRVIFNHIEKTAGQAINLWLQRHLGSGTVTPNLIGDHRSLIRQYGGQYPIISGHVIFDGSGLDPRYDYLTVLREPVDRFVSWLFFVVNNTPEDDSTRALVAGARMFLASDGAESNDHFILSARNPYVEKFRQPVMLGEVADASKLDAAFEVAQAHALIGFYEHLPDFVDGLARFLKCEDYSPLPVHNVTRQRLACDKISGAMLENILKLTKLDRVFYRQMLERTFHQNMKIISNRAKEGRPHKAYTREFLPLPHDASWGRPAWEERYVTMYTAASMPTQNGAICGAAVESDRTLKYLNYGKTLHLGSGCFQIAAAGSFATAGAICVAELCCDSGETVLKSTPIVGNPESPTDFSLTIPLILDSDCKDMELRFMAPAGHKVRLDAWYLLQQEALEVFWSGVCERFLDAEEDGMEKAEAELIMLDGSQFKSTAGLRLGTTLQTRGLGGALCYGPYIPMAQGVWQVGLVGLVGPGGLGGAYVDVCFREGGQIVHTQALRVTPFNQRTDFISPPWCFTLLQDVEDIEIRVWVTQESQINLAGVLLRRITVDKAVETHVMGSQFEKLNC